LSVKKLCLKIITPAQVKVEEFVDMVIMRCIDGDMGILPGHDALSTALDLGILRIINDGNERKIAVYGGLAAVRDNILIILTHDAEWPGDIDRARAEVDRENAERRLQERTDDIEIQHDQILLRRALVQIEVSSYTYDDDSESVD